MKVYKNIQLAMSLSGVVKKKGKNLKESDLSYIENACLVEKKGLIEWIGPQKDLPKKYKSSPSVSLKGKTILPSFIECHTHTVFAGSRAKEFELRRQGKSYQEIAKAGGGIRATVDATNKASALELKKLAQISVDDFVRQGVTTIEIKSGYGLTTKEEIKILSVAKSLRGPQIVTTYLGLHAVPKDTSASAYLQEVIGALKKIQKHASRVDIFIEDGFFTVEQAKAYFAEASKLGLQIVVHADQLTRTGATQLATQWRAKSADHVIYVNSDDIKAMASSDMTAVLLPTSDQYLQIPYPKAREMLAAGVRVALATDFNPGTSPTRDLSYVGVLARLEMKMQFHEVVAAYTYNAACALGLENSQGSLEVGKEANFVVVDEFYDLFYRVGYSPVEQVYRLGKKIY